MRILKRIWKWLSDRNGLHSSLQEANTALYKAKMQGSRYLEGEEAIKKHPPIAYAYVRDVIKGPWPEGEACLRQNVVAWEMYYKNYKSSYIPEKGSSWLDNSK